jgi:hypothetical protein
LSLVGLFSPSSPSRGHAFMFFKRARDPRAFSRPPIHPLLGGATIEGGSGKRKRGRKNIILFLVASLSLLRTRPSPHSSLRDRTAWAHRHFEVAEFIVFLSTCGIYICFARVLRVDAWCVLSNVSRKNRMEGRVGEEKRRKSSVVPGVRRIIGFAWYECFN